MLWYNIISRTKWYWSTRRPMHFSFLNNANLLHLSSPRRQNTKGLEKSCTHLRGLKQPDHTYMSLSRSSLSLPFLLDQCIFLIIHANGVHQSQFFKCANSEARGYYKLAKKFKQYLKAIINDQINWFSWTRRY